MAPKSIYLKAKGGLSYGWGHVIRMRTLAYALLECAWVQQLCVCVEADEGIREKLDLNEVQHQFVEFGDLQGEVAQLESMKPDVVIIDMLYIDDELIRLYRSHGCRIIAFNDMADQDYAVDMMIYPQVFDHVPQKKSHSHLAGAKYFILNPNFTASNITSHEKSKIQQKTYNLFVYSGGCISKENFFALEQLIMPLCDLNVEINFILGFDCEARSLASGSHAAKNLNYIEGSDRLYEYAALADLALVSSGYIKYELACAGVPALLFSIVEHQDELGVQFAKHARCAQYVGYLRDLQPNLVKQTVVSLLGDEKKRAEMSAYGKSYVDGQGAVRVCEAIAGID